MSKRYVLVAQIECDPDGRLLYEPEDGVVSGERDIEVLEGPIPFVRFGIVDRGRQNKTVHSGYSLDAVADACAKFNRDVDERREAREAELSEVNVKTMTA